jgi:histidinol phosphatase-like PHP family hydrolase
MIKDLGGSIAISSDCHSAAGLDCAFDKAEALAKAVGFDEYAVIGDGGIEYIKF